MHGAAGHECICRSCMELLVMHVTDGHTWNCWPSMELLVMHGELKAMHGTAVHASI